MLLLMTIGEVKMQVYRRSGNLLMKIFLEYSLGCTEGEDSRIKYTIDAQAPERIVWSYMYLQDETSVLLLQ